MFTFDDIIVLCEAGVSLEVDTYLLDYMTFEQGLDRCEDWDIPAGVYGEMTKFGHIVQLRAYASPNDFEYVFAGSPQLAIDRMYVLLTGGDEE